MFSKKTEFTVGVFMIVGIAALIYLSVSLGNIEIFSGSKFYTAKAQFDSVAGLKNGANVEIAGVQVGKVKNISLSDDMAFVEMSIYKEIKVSDDTIASIRTNGIIGEKFIKLTPGGSDEFIENNGIIIDTESAISLEELISKYIFEK